MNPWRALLSVLGSALILGCGDTEGSQHPPNCGHGPAAYGWSYELFAGEQPISDIWVGVTTQNTTFLRWLDTSGAIYARQIPGGQHKGYQRANALHSIWGNPEGDTWVVGEHGAMLHALTPESASWTEASETSQSLRGVWGTADDDVWAVGDGGTVLHFDGHSWIATQLGTADLVGVWASGTEAWAVGKRGSLFHFRGGEWFPVAAGIEADFRAVHGRGTSDVWIVGTRGAVLHWNGEALSGRAQVVDADLFDVWADPDGDTWIVGQHGTIVRLSDFEHIETAQINWDEAAVPDVLAISGARRAALQGTPDGKRTQLMMWAGASNGSILNYAMWSSTMCE